jgi:4-hydroxybenzoate polyprenyltransferase
MAQTTAGRLQLSRLPLFLALSRTPHGLLDICTPLLAVLLWLGRFPSARITLLGAIAAFAGYTAVYALNDIVDYQTDRQKILQAGSEQKGNYLDGNSIRHPLARGLLSMQQAAAWAGGWTLVSLVAAYLLNPVCVLILLAGCLLEIIYCRLLLVSQLRTLVSGVVKTLGGLAAVFAVDPAPDPSRLLLLFLWLFLWEIGGQNVPADWHDIEEDAAMGARTVPVYYGPRGASIIALTTLSLSLAVGGLFMWRTALESSPLFLLAGLATGGFLLLLPGWRLFVTRHRDEATSLFNRASYYPLSQLLIVGLALIR